MLLPRNMFCFSARMWGAPPCVGSPKAGTPQAAALEPRPSAPTAHGAARAGESRWAHGKGRRGISETRRKEGKRDGRRGQGGMWEGGVPGAEPETRKRKAALTKVMRWLGKHLRTCHKEGWARCWTCGLKKWREECWQGMKAIHPMPV